MKKKLYLCSKFNASYSMKRTISILLLSVLTVVYAVPAFGWGQEGHRIVAQIAYDNLTHKARKQVDKLLGDHGLIYWANWGDEIKSDNIYPQSISDGWHFQDLNPGMSDSLVADALTHYPKEGGNLYRALDSLELEMAAERASAINAVHVLRFLTHLHADRYCPMHMAHMDDKGGNLVKMKWFGKDTNLHNVWDTRLIESQGYSYTEYAAMIQREYKYMRREIEQKTDEQLLVESYHLTQSIYQYQEIWNGNTYQYIYTWREPMEKQLYIAGLRLAQVLNRLFK